jgi:hypothetical protein
MFIVIHVYNEFLFECKNTTNSRICKKEAGYPSQPLTTKIHSLKQHQNRYDRVISAAKILLFSFICDKFKNRLEILIELQGGIERFSALTFESFDDRRFAFGQQFQNLFVR